MAAPRGRAECDITDDRAVRALLDQLRRTCMFNAAAYTDVDGAETEPEPAFAANAEGPEVLARAAAGGRRAGALLDRLRLRRRARAPYDECVPPAPLGLRAVQAGG